MRLDAELGAEVDESGWVACHRIGSVMPERTPRVRESARSPMCRATQQPATS